MSVMSSHVDPLGFVLHRQSNDNGNDTQKSLNICRWRPVLTSKSVGVMTRRKKISVALVRLALLVSCALKHC